MNLTKHCKKKILIVSAGICLSLSSCSVTPVTHDRETIAYDGNDQTAGILGFNETGGLTISPGRREEFNSLIERFGSKTTPPTKKDFGITFRSDGNYDLTLQGAERLKELKLMEERERINDSDKLLNL